MSLLIIKHLRVAFGNKVNILLVIIFLKNDDYYVPSITLLVEKKNTLEISEGVLCSPSPPPQPASRLGVGEKKEKKIVLQ